MKDSINKKSEELSEKQETLGAGFKPVKPQIKFPELEEEIQKYWKGNKIFEKSITSRPENKKWNFLDGPPFVTGVPHYGSLLSSLPKDVFPRFKTMQGYKVPRVWGWDGHGLPIENKVEGELNIKRKKDIEEKVGIGKFIEECKKYVNKVSGEWEWYVDRIGRWVDFKNAYKTWDVNYMESVMWVFKQMYDKGYIYKGLRVSLYCPHCSTPISNFEVAMDADNYKDITEPATTYKYKVRGEDKTYFLAWSTTPWNKIATPALAVNPILEYVKIKQGEEYYVLAKSTLKMLKPEKYEVAEEYKGKDLVGREFEPHYDFYTIEPGKKAFIVIGGDFVTADEGTGIVTLAAYGEEDMVVMQKENIQIVLHVDDEGMIREDVPKFGGMYYLKADKAVSIDLKERELIYKEDNYTHSVAHCWRCATRLFYNPQDAWYVNVQILKKQMKATNEKINWVPPHFKYGRFLKSLESAPDWNISRNRYWGSPIPVWECDECNERFVPGSIKELEEASGRKINDLHKPEIDEVTVKCKKCGKTAKRVSEVLDSWIEAGSAPYAEHHFPFAKGIKLEDFFPPDFIVEYTGQIRAWFYVLHVISSALFDSNAFKNVAVTGVILGTDGRKMSKNYGNYPDPKELLQKYGGDALRLYLLGSPVMNGEDIIISEEKYREQVKGILLILWNVYNFFVTYANVDAWHPQVQSSNNVLDRWILSLLNGLIKNVTENLEKYNTVRAIGNLENFINRLSTWYIRRSRERVGPSAEDQEDKEAFYSTTHDVLVTLVKLAAPVVPFITEDIYRNLTNGESVHLENWPEANKSLIDEKLEKEMENGMILASIIHGVRKLKNVRVRIPIRKLSYKGPFSLSEEVKKVVLDEVNVYELVYEEESNEIFIKGDLNDANNQDLVAGMARDIIRKIQEERKKLGTKPNEKINVTLTDWPEKFEEYIKRRALIENLEKGDSFSIKEASE